MALQAMNASPHHPKVKTSIRLGESLYVAGGVVAGKMQLECKADKGLGIGIITVELYAMCFDVLMRLAGIEAAPTRHERATSAAPDDVPDAAMAAEILARNAADAAIFAHYQGLLEPHLAQWRG